MSLYFLYHFVTALITLGCVIEANRLEEFGNKYKLTGLTLFLMLISPALVPITVGAWFANSALKDDETSNN